MRSFLFVAVLPLGLAFGQTPNPDQARSILETSLKDKNPDTRKHAVQALSLVSESAPWLSQLEAMLDDKDVEVRLACIASLLDLKSPRTAPALQKALYSDVPEVSFAAAKALWTLHDPSGREALISVVNGETKTASGFITRQKRDALRMMHTPQTMFLFAITEGAGLAPVPGLGAGASSVQGILSDPSVSGRAAAALLLSTDKSPEVLQALENALADTNWSVRAAAIHSIALRNDASLKPVLAPFLQDKKDAVRVRAAAAYLRLDTLKPAPSKQPAPREGKK